MADTADKPIVEATAPATTEKTEAAPTEAQPAKAEHPAPVPEPAPAPAPATDAPVSAPVITDAIPPAPATASTEPAKAEAPVEEVKPEPSSEQPETPAVKPVEQTAEQSVEQPAEKSEAPAAETSGPTWPELSDDHPISKLLSQLSDLIKEADYDEVYGVKLSGEGTFHTKLILQKFLRANANDIEKAKTQLLATLKWRKEFDPLKTKDEVFSKKKFGGLGYVTILQDVPESPNKEDVVTYNIYGAVKDNKETFGDLDGFIRWRVALMELSLGKLKLSEATKPIPDYGKGPDPYQGIQIHDYLSISFIRQDPVVKAASKKTIDVMQQYYPETLSRKFFVNVPVVMGWVFSAMKLVLAKETIKKFTVLSYGKDLAGELGEGVPEVYGGKGGSLDTAGETLNEKDEEAAVST